MNERPPSENNPDEIDFALNHLEEIANEAEVSDDSSGPETGNLFEENQAVDERVEPGVRDDTDTSTNAPIIAAEEREAIAPVSNIETGEPEETPKKQLNPVFSSLAAVAAIIIGASVVLSKLNESPSEPPIPMGPNIANNAPTVPQKQYVDVLRQLDERTAEVRTREKKIAALQKEIQTLKLKNAGSNRPREQETINRSAAIQPVLSGKAETTPGGSQDNKPAAISKQTATPAQAETASPAKADKSVAKATQKSAAKAEKPVASEAKSPPTNTKPATESPKAPAKGSWVVFALSTNSKEAAGKRLTAFQSDGLTADITSATVKGRLWYRVRLTDLPTKQDAQAKKKLLAEKYGIKDAWIRKL